MGEAGEAEVPRPALEEPAGQPDGVDDGSGDPAPGQARHGVVEKCHVEAGVVRDEHGVAREREEAPHGHVLARRAADIARPDARQRRDRGRQRLPGVDERLEASVQASASTRCAPISTIREPRGERPVVSRSKTTNVADSRATSRARCVGEPDGGAAPLEPGVARDDLVEQRARNRRRGGGEREELASGVGRADRAAPRLDELDEAVGGVERELHPPHPDTNMCSCPVRNARQRRRGPRSGALGGYDPEELP